MVERGASLGKQRKREWDLSSELSPIATDQSDVVVPRLRSSGRLDVTFIGETVFRTRAGPRWLGPPMLPLGEPVGVACPSLSGERELSTPMAPPRA